MAHSAEEFVRQVWLRGWDLVQFTQLPQWMKDNDFIKSGHRPALNSYWDCVKSIFRIHTETGNIWTHLLGIYSHIFPFNKDCTILFLFPFLGFVLFVAIWILFFVFAPDSIQWQDKLVFSAFFVGAVICLGFSCIFHTLCCHSPKVSRFTNKLVLSQCLLTTFTFHEVLFSTLCLQCGWDQCYLSIFRLDYAGIAILTMGSFVPYLYYTFYCDFAAMVGYLSLICVLGITTICVSMLDAFATPRCRAVRAGSFIGLGLSGIIPATHYATVVGWKSAVEDGSLGWLILMALLYISGALLYALRVPERCLSGHCDIWVRRLSSNTSLFVRLLYQI